MDTSILWQAWEALQAQFSADPFGSTGGSVFLLALLIAGLSAFLDKPHNNDRY